MLHSGGLFDRMRSVEWLLLDDLGQSRKSTPFVLDALENTIMIRCDANLPVIVTTNQREAAICDQRGWRVWSRIMKLTRGRAVEMLGFDWRRSN